MLEKLSPILPARDMAATERFWSRLGFDTEFSDQDYLLMKREGAEVHFFHQAALDPATCDHGAYLRPADVNALDAEWSALGLPAAGRAPSCQLIVRPCLLHFLACGGGERLSPFSTLGEAPF